MHEVYVEINKRVLANGKRTSWPANIHAAWWCITDYMKPSYHPSFPNQRIETFQLSFNPSALQLSHLVRFRTSGIHGDRDTAIAREGSGCPVLRCRVKDKATNGIQDNVHQWMDGTPLTSKRPRQPMPLHTWWHHVTGEQKLQLVPWMGIFAGFHINRFYIE